LLAHLDRSGIAEIIAARVLDRVTPILETERLRLREFTHRDLDDLAAMVSDEEQMRFYRAVRTREDAAAWISRNLALYERHGYGMWLIEPTAATEFAGYCGIRPLELEGVSETEIGWHVSKSFWNRGIATEAARAVRDLARMSFGLERLTALVHPDNLASRRVAEKLGMQEVKTTVFEGEPTVIYVT
jgi:RimJ/RimL family protein N-acetyltransferase